MKLFPVPVFGIVQEVMPLKEPTFQNPDTTEGETDERSRLYIIHRYAAGRTYLPALYGCHEVTPGVWDDIGKEGELNGEVEYLYQCPAFLGEQADDGIYTDRNGQFGTKADAHER